MHRDRLEIPLSS